MLSTLILGLAASATALSATATKVLSPTDSLPMTMGMTAEELVLLNSTDLASSLSLDDASVSLASVGKVRPRATSCNGNQCRPGGTYTGRYTFTPWRGNPAGCSSTYCDLYLPGGVFHSRCTSSNFMSRGFANEECAATCAGKCPRPPACLDDDAALLALQRRFGYSAADGYNYKCSDPYVKQYCGFFVVKNVCCATCP